MKKRKQFHWLTDFRLASALFIGIIALIAAALINTASYHANTHASQSGTAFEKSRWDSELSRVIHADNTQSVKLSNGSILWVFGDTTQIIGKSTVGGYGYPHNTFVKQAPDTLFFTVVPGKYGYGWQQVPNWPDNSYFWMGTPVVENGTVYILGVRIKGASPFTVVGNYVALFDERSLSYDSLVRIPGGPSGKTIWGGAVKTSNGFWITGTHGVNCSYATDCKVGDLAFVPFGDLAKPREWKIHADVIPASFNVGTTLALLQTGDGWDIFTKVGDGYGGVQIERLTAATPIGPWTVSGKWSAPSPSGTVTYGVGVHPEQTSRSGDILVSYNVNGISDAYHPLFEYLPR